MHILLSGLAIAGGNQQKGENMDEEMSKFEVQTLLRAILDMVKTSKDINEAAEKIRKLIEEKN